MKTIEVKLIPSPFPITYAVDRLSTIQRCYQKKPRNNRGFVLPPGHDPGTPRL